MEISLVVGYRDDDAIRRKINIAVTNWRGAVLTGMLTSISKEEGANAYFEIQADSLDELVKILERIKGVHSVKATYKHPLMGGDDVETRSAE